MMMFLKCLILFAIVATTSGSSLSEEIVKHNEKVGRPIVPRQIPFHLQFRKVEDLTYIFGEWTIRCVRQTFSECIIFQKRVDGDTKKILYWAEFSENQYSKETTLSVVVPTHIESNLGVTIQIDGLHIANASVSACFREGCIARVKLNQSAVNHVLRGNLLQTIVLPSDKPPIGLAMPVKGLYQAYSEMKLVFYRQNLSLK